MTADPFIDRLSEYLDADEDMTATERAAIEAHLVTCASCRTTLAELREVAARAASLPIVPPAADLWEGVAARLESRSSVRPFQRAATRRFSFTLPQLIAAGLALMVLSGGMVWIARLGDPRTNLPAVVASVDPPPTPAPTATPVEEEPSHVVRTNLADARYDAAIADLEKTLAAGRDRLDPETIRTIENNLLSIDRAIEQSRKALREDPSNVYLNNHFNESRNRKLALLRRVTALAMGDESGSN